VCGKAGRWGLLARHTLGCDPSADQSLFCGASQQKKLHLFLKKSISKWHAQLEVIHPEAIKTGTFTAIEKITQVISRQILYCCCCILEVYCQRLRAYLIHLIKLLLHAYKLSSTKFSMTTVHEFGGAEKISHRGIRTRP
jgi:hypothetical protein